MKEKKILMNYLLYILAFVGICIVGITKIFALETKTIYSVNNNGTLASANTYNYGYLTGGGTQGIAKANVNTTISGVAYGFNFQFYENVVLNKTYTLVINFMDIDLLKTFNSSMVQISTCNSTTCNENTLVSVVKNNNNGNSNKLTIEFNPITTGPIILVNLGSDQAITGVSTFGIKSVTLDSTNQNQEIINNQTNNTNNIINNNNSNTQEIIDSSASNTENIINNQNQNTQDIINSQYTCNRQTIDLYNYELTSGYLNTSGNQNTNNSYITTSYIKIQQNKNYEINLNYTMGSPAYCLYDNNLTLISCTSFNSSQTITFNSSNAEFIKISLKNKDDSRTSTLKGDICLKDSEEQTKTSKGILGKLGDVFNLLNPFSENFFAYKLIELLGELLKNLFVPSKEYMTNWYQDFRDWIELKLGFLATPITLFLDFINMYLNLEETDIIINIPEITVPNFEENILVQAQTFNWGDLLRSKPAFQTLWNLYLDFIDVYLILNFLGLCEVTYNRIFGGDTSQYEYYTVEDTYSINDETGEATNHQLRQRRTRREKV